jgi:hypothetical protein
VIVLRAVRAIYLKNVRGFLFVGRAKLVKTATTALAAIHPTQKSTLSPNVKQIKLVNIQTVRKAKTVSNFSINERLAAVFF